MRRLVAGALLLGCAALSACSAAASAGIGVGLNILVKAFEIDTAIINDIKARKDAAADASTRAIQPGPTTSDQGRGR